MAKNNLSYKEKKHKINFFENADYTRYFALNGEVMEKHGGYDFSGPMVNYAGNFTLNKCYRLNGYTYIYANKKIGIIKNIAPNFVATKTFEGAPILVPILINGAYDTLAVYGGEGVAMENPSLTVTVSDCDFAVSYDNRVFTAKDNTLKFGGEFDYVNSSYDLNVSYVLKLDGEYGKIVGMEVLNDKLFIICKKRILKLERESGKFNFKLTEVKTIGIIVSENTVAKTNNYVMFMSKGKVCRFDGNKLESFYNPVESSLTPYDRAISSGEYYMIKVKDENNADCFACVNSDTMVRHVYRYTKNFKVSDRGGIAITPSYYEYYFFNPLDTGAQIGEWKSKEMVISEDKSARIFEISALVSGVGEIRITGNGREYIFELQTGLNTIKTSIMCQNIKIYVKSNTRPFKIENLTLTTRTRG